MGNLIDKMHELTPLMVNHFVKPIIWRTVFHVEREPKFVYTTNVGYSTLRIYDDQTLPDEIKLKFAFIGAQDKNIYSRDEAPKWIDHIGALAYNPMSPGININTEPFGWRVSYYFYTLMVEESLLEKMRGHK